MQTEGKETLKQRIYKSLCITALLALILSTLASQVLYFRFYDKQTDENLMLQTDALCAGINEVSEEGRSRVTDFLEDYLGDTRQSKNIHLRITLVDAADGVVLYDSEGNTETMDSHLDRREIEEAMTKGSGQAVRLSKTLGRNTHYAAMLTNDKQYVIRLGMETSNIIGIFLRILPAILAIMALLFLLATQMATRLTHQIVAPLDSMAEKIQKMDTPTLELSDEEVYEELRPFVNSVKQSQQVREEFSANVSHELKTPLTSISGFAELMKDGMVVDAAHVREFSTTIYNESQRLLALIDDIMHLSRLEAGIETEQEPVNLYLLSEMVIQRLRDKAEKYQVSIDLTGGSAEVTGVRTNIEEMIYNLIDNSIKYNHPDGHVYVICEGKAITVQDDGIGIPEEDLNRVWERFFRVDKSHSRAIGGTGLGLSIVKHVAELHHAKVDISSQLNHGTKITITFPK